MRGEMEKQKRLLNEQPKTEEKRKHSQNTGSNAIRKQSKQLQSIFFFNIFEKLISLIASLLRIRCRRHATDYICFLHSFLAARKQR